MPKGDVPFHTIIILVITIIMIVMSIILYQSQDATQGSEEIKNRTQQIKNFTEQRFEICDGVLSDFQRNMYKEEGGYGGWMAPDSNVTNIFEVQCNVPGSGIGSCVFDSFFLGQEVGDKGHSDDDRGYYSFEFLNPPKKRRFEFTCVWNHDNYNDGAVKKTSWKKDMRDSYDSFGQIVSVPSGESATVKTKFALMTRYIGSCTGSPITDDYCEEQPNKGNYCNEVDNTRFYNWTFIAGGYYCCPEAGPVKDINGIYITINGTPVREDWRWDTELQICCVNETCTNYYECEDLGGKWAYGTCWFSGTSTCTNVCNSHQHSDGSNFQCVTPDWRRIPTDCTLHKILGFGCSANCQSSASARPPYVSGGNCYWQNDYFVTNWCDGSALGNERICSCK